MVVDFFRKIKTFLFLEESFRRGESFDKSNHDSGSGKGGKRVDCDRV
ncbi:hypothetical protein D922_03099 [Enterococcus faecalis 06-MB-DW-09]|nr:hypothetical protein D922_03099 [Enterococcus faecalis 06-MB-DW-09]